MQTRKATSDARARGVPGQPPWTIPIRAGVVARVADVGGKGAALVRLAGAGFPVPAGFCVTTAAYRRTLAAQVVGATDGASMQARIVAASLPEPLVAAVADAHDALVRRGATRLAVRSSSTFEDTSGGSFAGQAESFLGVEGLDDLLAHVKRCWASLFRTESLLYRLRHRADEPPPEMAVVVQEMVAADAAGVLFTANPITGARDEIVVSSAYGLGEAVVDGRAADTYTLDKVTGGVRTRDLAAKRDMARSGAARNVRIERVPVPAEKVNADSLDGPQLRTLADLARRIEVLFGAPQDIEWAVAGDRTCILQSRPITAGRGLGATNGDGPTVWSNVNVGEALPGVGTPMTWSVIRAFSRRGFEQAFGALGLKVPPEYEIVGSFNGRIYLNLTEFMSIASQIPFFPPERLLTMGGGGGLTQLDGCYEKRSPLRFMAHLPLTLPRMAASQAGLPWLSKAWSARFLRHRRRFEELDLDALPPTGLLAALDDVTDVFNRTGTLMLACASNALSSYIAVLALLRRWAGEDAVELQERLFVGLSAVRSAAPGLALLRIAHRVREVPELARVFAETPEDEVLDALRAHPAGGPVCAALDAFLREYGQRAPREAELATPRWREDPRFIVGVVRAHLRSAELPSPESVLAHQAEVRREATEEVARRMPAPQRPVFRTVLALAQHAARIRERMRDHVVDTLSMYRTFLLAVGRRLVAGRVAATRDDVFFLTMEEVRGWLEARAAGRPDDLACGLRIPARRAEYEAFCATPDPPDSFRLQGGRMEPEELPEDVARGPLLRGLGGSPGRISGVARVILDPRDGGRLEHGEILVAPYTDVGWTPLFLIAGGVVMDLGGALSHSCVVAREYGLPAVVNVKHGTSRIRDGQRITVDGDAGVVYLNGASS